jgi:hypothetical protein
MIWRPFASGRDLADYLILLTTGALGFAGAPWWSIIGAASALSALGWERWNELGLRAKRVDASDIFAIVMFVRLAFACAVATASFVLGSALRWSSGL